ncbi:MAG TPA: glycosyltransferase family 2 protein, partial [Flavobacteriales bacterium]|nr:glycosyltransferase family 2 protein [Flavobacteriales bacterium]
YRDRLAHYVSEPDKGVYDAMNKGLRAATGEVIGFVNAGDLLMTPKVIAQVVEAFQRAHVDAVYGDIIMVDEHDIHKVHRTWLSGTYHRANFRKGWMPPHVGTFIRKSAYDRFGHFNTDLRIAADYEILLRMLYKHEIRTIHLREVLVRFRLGGMSNGSVKQGQPRSARLVGLERPASTAVVGDPQALEQGDAVLPLKEATYCLMNLVVEALRPSLSRRCNA